MAAPGTPTGVYPFMSRKDRAHGYLPGVPLRKQIKVTRFVAGDVAADAKDCVEIFDALGLDPATLADRLEEMEWAANRAESAYRGHREECWYTGEPDYSEHGCTEHARLYDAWQEALRTLGIREEDQ
jgi:hypothetical protein